MRRLIKQMRDDMKRLDMVVILGRLSEFKNGPAGWDTVRAAKVNVAEADRLAA